MKKIKPKSLVALMMCCFLAGCGKKPTYTVTWIIDGEPHEETYEEGVSPSYKGETPSKVGDRKNTYTFTGWDKEISPVTGNITYTAEFSATLIDYTITWSVDNSETKEVYHFGDLPSFKGTTEKASDSTYDYQFRGWDKEIVPVENDTTYTAVYDSSFVEYTITWVVDGKTTEESYHYGEKPSFKGNTDKTADNTYTYQFKSWDKDIAPVTENTTYTALYDASYIDYTITWVVDETSTQESYHYGDIPSFKGSTEKAASAEFTYQFKGWDKKVKAVTGNETYTALYDQTKNKYTITWIIGDKTVTDEVEYGVVPEAPTDTEKDGNDEYTYTFLGWDKEVKAVSGNEIYTARYQETKNQYDVTFVNEGSELGRKKVTYGEILTASDIVAPEKEGLTFYGWKIENKEYTPTALPVITHAVTAEAIYKAAIEVRSVNHATEEVLSTKTVYFNPGEDYRIEADTKEGFVADKDYVKGTAKKNDSLTIHYSTLSVWDAESEEMTAVDENHYQISNSRQFAYFAQQVNSGNNYSGKTITLTSSLEINKDFPKIGTADDSFQGTFDGNNCSIRGIDISDTATRTALFYGITNATIKNVSLYGTAKAAQYGSVLVGRISGSTIENVTNYASLEQQGSANGAGAIAGSIVNGSTIRNSANYGDVTGTASNNKTAGIVGLIEGKGANSVHHSVNYGTIKGATLTGGIVGEVAAATSTESGVFDSENHGTIVSIAVAGSKKTATIGGIAGQITGAASTAKLNGCSNYGDVTGSTAIDSPVGGIVGENKSKTAEMSNLENYGNILSNSRTGGIVGNLAGALTDAKNHGTIQAEGTGTNKGCYAGGLVGVGFTGSSMEHCENDGSVITALRYAGGILGAIGSKATVTIKNCTNDGSVTAGTNGAGGITGGTIDTASTLTATSCTNNGAISGNNKVGGLVGCLWSSTSTLTACVNNGTYEATTAGTSYFGSEIGQTLEQYNEENAQ